VRGAGSGRAPPYRSRLIKHLIGFWRDRREAVFLIALTVVIGTLLHSLRRNSLVAIGAIADIGWNWR
jgi:uncharacterized RDD family membrane protein YckC